MIDDAELLARCIHHVRPGAAWTLYGHNLKDLWWEGPGPEPTEKELLAALPAVRAKLAEERRAAAIAERAERLGPDYVVKLLLKVIAAFDAVYAALPEATKNRVDKSTLADLAEVKQYLRTEV